MNEEDGRKLAFGLTLLIAVIGSVYFLLSVGGMWSAIMTDPSNMKDGLPFPWDLKFGTKTFVENESYLKYTFDSAMNYDQTSMNRGIDFSKCYVSGTNELAAAVANDTHYQKIRGNTPDDALKTLSFPVVMLKAGFSIPDPDHLYVSQFRQISPDEYKIWVVVKTPVSDTVDGALEGVCRVNYYY